MALEDKEKQQDKKRIYMFRICPSCGVKMHINAFLCWSCEKRHNYNVKTSKWEDIIHGSENENDAIYSLLLNNADKCFSCQNTKKGSPCKYAHCFGTGKGICDTCNRFESIRFMCCQETVEFYKKLESDKAKKREFEDFMMQRCRQSVQLFESKVAKEDF